MFGIITLMASYAERYAQKTTSLDTVITEEAHRLEIDDLTRQEISALRKEDTDYYEAISHQLWKKRQSFLKRKKNEELDNNSFPSVPIAHVNCPVKWKLSTSRADKLQNWRQH